MSRPEDIQFTTLHQQNAQYSSLDIYIIDQPRGLVVRVSDY